MRIFLFLVLNVLALACSDARSQTREGARLVGEVRLDPAWPGWQAYPEVLDLYRAAQLDRAVQALLVHQERHENDPEFFNLLGLLAMQQKAFGAAAAAFEHVVLMQPDNAGAWLDLAIAHTEAGNDSQAGAYFDYIEVQFSPPPALKFVIGAYRKQIAQRGKLSAPWRHTAEIWGGYDSNANSGLQSGSIPITLASGAIELPLDPSFRPRSDEYLQLVAHSRYRTRFGQQGLEFTAGVRQRNYRREHAFSSLDLTSGLSLQRNTALGDVSAAVYAEYFALAGQGLLHNVRTAVTLERTLAACRIGWSAEAERRRYLSGAALSANLLWAQAGLACDFPWANIPMQSTLVARYGQDAPDGWRAGGATARTELIAQLSAPLVRRARLDLSLTWSQSQDQEGYSPLLENNAARRLDRLNLRLQLNLPLSEQTDLSVNLENGRVHSNLPLFRQSGYNLGLGLARHF